jgi:hypothetical protein
MSGSSRAPTLAAVMVLLAVIVAGCTVRPGASGQSPTATPAASASSLEAQTGVRGTVTAGPTCPVVTDPPTPGCADRPVAGAVLVFNDASGAEVARVTSAQDGSFSVHLAAGAYQLVPQPYHGLMGTPAPMDVSVDAGRPMTEVAVSYDTGIR